MSRTVKIMAKAQKGKTVYALFNCAPYWDGGNDLMSLHRTKDRAKAAHDIMVASGNYTKYDLDIQKLELAD